MTKTLRISLAMLATLSMASAHAATPTTAFVLEAYEKVGGPRWIAGGRYKEEIALRTRATATNTISSNMTATNLCVAYIKTAQLHEARAACDRAVTTARSERAAASVAWTYGNDDRLQSIARSYSNRAVLNWVGGDRAAAEADLARAAAIAPRAHFVMKNVAALTERGYGATVTAAMAEPVGRRSPYRLNRPQT